MDKTKTPKTSEEPHPSTRNEMSRVGVVDIGSNSVRLVVFDGAGRSPGYFYNEKVMCQLGADMNETGRLNPEGRERALKAIRRFQLLGKRMGTGPLRAVATAAMREAKDGPEFHAQIEKETGLKLAVIDGVEEATLSAQGVLLGWPGSYGLVADLGGSSMELAEIGDGKIGKCLTSPLAPLRLREFGDDLKGKTKFIRKTLTGMLEKLGPQHDRLFLVGGSWRALARIDMYRRDYPLHVLHEYRMTCESVKKTIELLRTSDHDNIRRACRISSARMALVPDAALVLEHIIELFEPHDIAISSYGLREGLLFEKMPQALRDCDPLLEACRFAEQRDARVPGFGIVLFEFIRGLFPGASTSRLRIIEAACLLHDVSWRAHPDYRGQICFDNATRANLGGLTHSERVFLGLSLMYRYSNRQPDDFFDQVLTLLDEDDQKQAVIVGRAMRFGAMMWMETNREPGHLHWSRDDHVLTLKLSGQALELFGEVAESRLNSLGAALGAETVNVEII